MKHIGRTRAIHDARGKATGRLVYAGDMLLPRMAHARLVLSTRAHAVVTGIDAEPALATDGVLGVFSHENAPLGLFDSSRLIPGQEESVDDEPLFAREPRYIGDRVAAVVADSAETARRAARLIEVTYAPLPVVADLAAIDGRAGRDAEVDGRRIDDHRWETRADYGGEADIPGDWVDVATRVATPKVHHAAMETHVCVADYDDGVGLLTIWSPCQGVFGVRTVVADLLGLPYHAVRVVKTAMGGSFGGKQEVLLEPVTAFLALALRRPVKLQLDRLQSIIATMTRPATISRIASRVRKDGRLAACDIDSILDAGAYTSSSIAYGRALGSKISRLYRVPRVTNRARTYLTNSPKAGGARGWGSPEFFAAMEIHMDAAAAALGMDPVALRLKNLVRPGDMDLVRRLPLGNARIAECVERGAAAFGWREKWSAPRDHGPLRRGVGMACAAHTNGMVGGFPDFSTMTLKMQDDGSFILNTCLHDMGCGTLTSMAQLVAEVLDVEPERIRVLEADTQRSPYDFGTYGSRVTYICGAGAVKIAEAVRDRILDVAARKLERPVADLDTIGGAVCVRGASGGGAVSYAEIARLALAEYDTEIIATRTYNGVSNPGSYGAHFVEVEVDAETGLVRILDYLAVHDVGRAINPGMIEGQIQGGVQMGIGYALSEQVVVDQSGRVRIEGLKDYHLVNAPDMPEVRVLLLEEGGDDGPFGAKSIGETATVPSAPAVVNAVNHALGVFLTDLPVTPEKIIAALEPQRAERHGN